MFEDNIPGFILLKKRIKRKELTNWAKDKSSDFNGDSSTEALKYFLFDFKEDLIQSFNNHITFKVESVEIEEVNDMELNLIFEIEESYTAFHKPEEKKLTVILVNGSNIYSLDYSGFEIGFKPS